MPSFDIVSKLDLAEVDNAVAGIVREISTRIDFKGSKCTVERAESALTIVADDDLKLQQMHEKLKVQVAIQADELRITGKKRDDLQAAIAFIRGLKIEQPLQYVNFRD